MRKSCSLFALLAALGIQASAQQKKLDVTTFVVLGEGLSAGMADFSLRDVYQDKCFPAQMARQIKTAMPQPLIQSPGIGNVPGFPGLPVRVPTTLETTLRIPFPPPLFIFNLSVPGFRVADAVSRRPSAPLIQQNDVVQTSANVILGFPAMTLGKDKPLWTQVEYARNMNPTLVLIALGYYDVLEAAATGNPALLTETASFQTNYSIILTALKGSAEILVTTIPNPVDTAYFTSLPSATRFLGASPSVLAGLFNLRADDLITPNGLMTIGTLLAAGQSGPLPPGSIVSAATAGQITAHVQALNGVITQVAQQNGANVYDLAALFRTIRASGVQAGGRTLTADYLGGFYSLDGYYPGTTGHAVIANELLNFLNKTYQQQFPMLTLASVAASDPSGRLVMNSKKPGRANVQ